MKDTEKNAPKYVGFQDRLFATLVDMMIILGVLIPFVIISINRNPIEIPPELLNIENQLANGQITIQEANSEKLSLVLSSIFSLRTIQASILQFIVLGIVVIPLWFYRSATPGKMLLNMKIVDADTLGKPSTYRLLLRYFGYILFPGFLWIAVDRRKQGWHDKLANTVVIYKDGRPTKKFILVIGGILILSFLLLFI